MTRYDMADAMRNVIDEQREEIMALKAENAKLRELVRDMWHLLYDWLFKNHEVPWKELQAVHDRMRELGMEVPQ